MCRELRKKDVLQDVLRLAHDRSLNKYASIDEEDDFQVSFFIGWVIVFSSDITLHTTFRKK